MATKSGKFSVIIPAAGSGTRMNSNIPKALTKIGEKTFLEIQIEKFHKFSSEIYVVINREQRDIFEEFKTRTKVEIKFIVQEPGRGTYFAIKSALPFLEHDFVLICWADQIGVTLSLILAICDELRTKQNDVVLPLIRQEKPYVKAKLNERGVLSGWGYEREGESLDSGFSDLGVFGFTKEALLGIFEKNIEISEITSPLTGEINFLDLLPYISEVGKFKVLVWKDDTCAISVNSNDQLDAARKRLNHEKLHNCSVSIIIPSFNEGHHIKKLLTDLEGVLLANSQKAHVTYEVIFIDDGSTDDTRDILRGFKFRYVYQENQGKGAAVKKGAEFANGDFLIVLDADGEYLVSDVCKMAEAISENPLASIYGSRYLVDKFVPIRVLPLPNQSILNLYFNYLLSLIIYLRFQMFISDSLTGLKLYSKRVYDWINPKTTGFETDHEISLFLIRNEIPIKEIAIDYFARTKAQGKKISTKDAFKALSLWLR